MTEQDILHAIMREAPKMGARLFRNNVGEAWMGPYKRLTDGTVLITKPMRVRYGIPGPGGADLLGWVTRDGRAYIVAVEVKTPTGRVSPKQLAFIDGVCRMGGIAGVCRSVADFRDLINGAFP